MTGVGWAGLAMDVRALAQRIEALEADSHPPIDLGPAIDEILAAREAAPVCLPETQTPPDVVSLRAAIAALQPLVDLLPKDARDLPDDAIVTRSSPLVSRAIRAGDCRRAADLVRRYWRQQRG